MVIRLTIPIIPKAQARDRITARGGFARSYTSKEQRLETNKLLTLIMAQKPLQCHQGPVSLDIIAYLPIPKSKPRVWREKALRGEIRPITKPDVDNYAKQILDVMNGVYFDDDRQVVDLKVSKYYVGRDNPDPCWQIIYLWEY